MVKIDFYHYPNRRDTVNKVLGEPTTAQGILFNETNILNPSIKVRFNGLFAFNYCYIHELQRYYHIDKINIVETNVVELSLHIDVLKTYETAIMEATATVKEREQANKFISTRQNVYDVRPRFEKIDFEKDLFNETGNIVVVAIKGNV